MLLSGHNLFLFRTTGEVDNLFQFRQHLKNIRTIRIIFKPKRLVNFQMLKWHKLLKMMRRELIRKLQFLKFWQLNFKLFAPIVENNCIVTKEFQLFQAISQLVYLFKNRFNITLYVFFNRIKVVIRFRNSFMPVSITFWHFRYINIELLYFQRGLFQLPKFIPSNICLPYFFQIWEWNRLVCNARKCKLLQICRRAKRFQQLINKRSTRVVVAVVFRVRAKFESESFHIQYFQFL